MDGHSTRVMKRVSITIISFVLERVLILSRMEYNTALEAEISSMKSKKNYENKAHYLRARHNRKRNKKQRNLPFFLKLKKILSLFSKQSLLMRLHCFIF